MKKNKVSARGKLMFLVFGLLWYPAILFIIAERLGGGRGTEPTDTAVAVFIVLLAAGELAIAAAAFIGWRRHRKKQDEEQEKQS